MKSFVKASAVAATLLVAFATLAQAQTIKRVKPGDNHLSCKQVQGEIALMDETISRANQTVAAAAQPPLADARSYNGVGATGIAGDVAKTAFSAFGFGGKGGAVASIVGGVAQHALASEAQQQQQAQLQQQSSAAQVQAQQAQQAQAQQARIAAQQAQSRKEHLTALSFTKGCKTNDVQQ